MVYENKALYTIKIDLVLNMKIQYIPFVTVAPHVDQNIAPSILSNLLDPFHEASSYHLFLILGARSSNDYNSVISDLPVLKLQPTVALCIIFPISPTWLSLDSPRKSYAQSPKMTWLYAFSEEPTCMKWHISLFWPSELKEYTQKTTVCPLSLTAYGISI